MGIGKPKFLESLQNYHQTYILLISVFIGMLVGVATSLMKTFVIFLKNWVEILTMEDHLRVLFFVLPVVGILLTILFLRYIIKDDVRHGIPRILYVLAKKTHMKQHKVFSSFVGGAITSGFGGSAGLESPIISTGASIGSFFSKKLNLDYKTTALLMGCGAAGAISSIFYTPIAAVVFGVEVLMLDLTTTSIIPLLVTSITGAITASRFMPVEVVFQFPIKESATIHDFPFLILLGILTGLLSVYFNRANFSIQKIFNNKGKKPLIRAAGMISLGILILLFPPLYGEGYDVLKTIINQGPAEVMNSSLFSALSDNYWMIFVFLVLITLLKVVTTTLTIESGGVGGVFAPAVFTGGLGGYLFADSINRLYSSWELSEENYAIVGMAGVLGGVLHAPLTAIFFAAEITEGYQLMLPLMLVSAISFVTNKFFDSHSIFNRQLADQGIKLSHNKDHNVLTLLSVEEVIDKDFLTIGPGATLGDLTKKIAKSRRNIFPVVDDKGFFLGLVAMDDVREDMFKPELYSQPVKKYIIQPDDFVSTTDTMEKVMEKFNLTGYYNLPVIDEGKYIGFISRSNTFSVYRKMLLDISYE
jgi:CIC family chloride channel protein